MGEGRWWNIRILSSAHPTDPLKEWLPVLQLTEKHLKAGTLDLLQLVTKRPH